MYRQLHRPFLIQLWVLGLVVGGISFWLWGEATQGPVVKAQEATASTPVTGTLPIYLPVAANDAGQLAPRMGYGATGVPINSFAGTNQLKAGWYLNWSLSENPVRPGGIEFAQVIFVHQKMACGDFYNRDRVTCPYAQPLDYVHSGDQASIEAIAKARPGSVWLIGNEMDRLDWKYCEVATNPCPPDKVKHTGQSEILPETYARAYHDLYAILKTADPTARVAIGGLIQPTPLRLQYLTIVWDTYKSLYGQDMPVDIWNIHTFILREVLNDYGAEIPPGLPGDPTKGEYADNDCTHIDKGIFDKNLRAFRQWMKERGQQEKPLYITEYGILYYHQVNQKDCKINFKDEKLVVDFMLFTFDYYMNTKDCNLGYTADECRLVQRWIWFSLDHLYQPGSTLPVVSIANPYSSLLNSANGQLTEAGRQFAQFASNNMVDLPK
jgi:hypothetical protein